MPPPPILALRDVRYRLGQQVLLDGAELAIGRGERLCLVGRNGSGKSTLLRIAAGELQPDAGERFLQPGTRVGRLEQEPDFTGHATVAAFVAAGLDGSDTAAQHRVDAMLDEVRLDGGRDPVTLSGGESRRAALARALVAHPDILLLDEPTNHLDLPTIEWLEARIEAFAGAVLLISHDRRFLERLTRVCLWLDRAIVRRLDAGFVQFDDWSSGILEREAVEAQKLDRLIEREAVWSVQSIRARRTRNQGRMRRLQDLRIERRRLQGPQGLVRMEASGADASGKLAIEAKGIAKSWGEREVLRPFATRILRGDRVGIVGPNGAGKTTLLRLLTGELEPDAGSVRLGVNLRIATIDQKRAALDPEKTVWETLAGRNDQVFLNGKPRHVMSYLRDFLFTDQQARQKVGKLSGGERNRLLLAQALTVPSNLLVLDEPTNDLDMETLDLLQELLADYDGTVLLVSHDRDFLDRVVTSTIAMEGDGSAIEYAGGYTDYRLQRGERAEAKAASLPSRGSRAGEGARRADGGATRVPTKLSYKQQRSLEELPKRIEALGREITALQRELADPTLFRRDGGRFAAAGARLATAQSELDAAEHEWLELELQREALART
jgi:ATP-binding cassette subfamily F protein uup